MAGARISWVVMGIAWLASGEPTLAHAIIVKSSPEVDAVVHGTTLPVELHFNSRIDRERSRVQLAGPGGSTATLALGSDTPPDVLAATAQGLAPGSYRLRWQVLSIDGHITRGDIPFQVQR